MASPSKKPAQTAPKQEYLHVLMALHPVHGKAIPMKTYEDEEEAWKAAAKNNQTQGHLGWHVKKIPRQ